MSDHNTYLACKKQTRYLLWWLCHASNAILQSSPKDQDNGFEAVVNSTGQVTTKEIVTMAKVVATRLPFQQIPSTIFRLFRSVISARSAAHANFVRIASHCEDEQMEKSNATHKHFIDRLTEAFRILGGLEWGINRATESDAPQSSEDIEKIIFSNTFSALQIHHCTGGMRDDEAGIGTLPTTGLSRGSGKVEGNQKTSQKRRRSRPTDKPAVLEVPLENFCIVDGPEGVRADYQMASISMLEEWADLRKHVQALWISVAYEDINVAVAGALSEMAIAMIRRTALVVFVEFPDGHDTFESMTYRSQDFSHNDSSSLNYDDKERCSLYIYHDLLEFLTDFQKNRNGRPTKRMQTLLSCWQPEMNLQQASCEQRVEWRRLYTISWLFDLVSVFSHMVLRENKIETRHEALEAVQWTIRTPHHRPHRLFGLEDFAQLITTWAVQKPGTNIRSKILPHHVFRLQCIVDSFTASRGW